MPKFFTSRGDYGLLLSGFLALRPQAPVSVAQAASQLHLPRPFLEQIAFQLRKANLFASKAGKNGGYLLSRSPNLISLAEIIEALEGPVQTVPCQEKGCAASAGCLTHSFWFALQRYLHKTLQQITLADLVSGSAQQLLPIQNAGKDFGRA